MRSFFDIRNYFSIACVTLVVLLLIVLLAVRSADAAPNFQINYQGKLTNSSNVAVPNGTYNMRFWLITSPTAPTTTAIWSEEFTNGGRVQVTNGLFSVMLGSSSPLASVDFNQTLYLAVEIGSSTATAVWDGEMSPRKVLGAVPAAFEADRVDGLTSSQFLRSDTNTTLSSTSASSLFTIIQNGTGGIMSVFDGATEVFSIIDGGRVGVGSTSPMTDFVIDGDFALTGGFYDNNRTRGQNGQVLQTTGAGVQWVSTTSLNIAAGASALASLTDVNVTGVASGSILVYNGSTWLDQATSSLGIDIADTRGTLAATRGGTGLSTVTANQLLIGNTGGTGWTQTATSALNIALSDTNGVLATAKGGTGVSNLGGANTVLYTTAEGTLASSSNFTYTGTNFGVGTTSPGEKFTLHAGIAMITEGDPLHIGSISDTVSTTLSAPWDIEVAGDFAYVSNGGTDDGIQVINISDPTNPIPVSSLVDDVNRELDGVRGISILGNYLYAAGFSDDGISIIDISDPTNLKYIGEIEDGGSNLLDGPGDIAISGNYAYVPVFTDNLVAVLDITNPTNPIYVGSVSDDGTKELSGPGNITIRGNYAYVTAYSDDGVEILDISNRAAPVHVGSITDTSDTALDGANSIVVSGNYAYVAGQNDNGIEILDISNPSSPVHVASSTSSMTTASDVEIAGSYLFATAFGNSTLNVFNISSSTRPVLVGQITDDGSRELSGPAYIAIRGNYVYVTGNADGGVEIVKISGLRASSGQIGVLKSDTIDTDKLFARAGLYGGSLNVQTDAMINGTLTVGGTASSSLISSVSYPSFVVQSGFMGLATSTPTGQFSIQGTQGTQPLIYVASSTAATSSYMYLTAGGKLGLGTSSPLHTLTVHGDARITKSLYDSYNTAGTLGQVLMTTATGTQWVATSSLNITSSAALASLTDVNVTGVASGSILVYNGSTWLDQATSSLGIDLSDTRGTLATSRGGTGVANLGGANTILYTTSEGTLASSSNLTFSGSKLAIGSTTPNALLTITNAVGTAANTPLFQVSSTTGGVSTTTLLMIASGGNVGIGTTTFSTYAGYPLIVSRSNSLNSGILIENPNAGSLSSATLLLRNDSGSNIGGLIAYSSVFTSSHLANRIGFSSATNGPGNGVDIVGTDTDDDIRFYTGGAAQGNERARFTPGGRFGIGTTSPTALLSVMGTTSTTSLLFQIASSSNAALLTVTHDGYLGLGSSSPQSLLTLDRGTGLTGTGVVAGMKQFFNFTNTTESALYYGNNTYIVNSPTATSTLVGSVIRVQDGSGLGNTIRGLEVQSGHGTTTKGENTALSGFARTFGVRGSTDGTAGSSYLPAGVFAETTGTTQGNAFRAYSGSITTEDLVSFFHDTSDFSGTGLLMNFGNAGGSFATSSNYVEFQRGGTTVFKVSQSGSTTIGDGTTNNPAGLMIGYGGLCVDNDGTCHASTTGRITSVSSALSNSDLAEMYFSSEALEPGDIVYATGIMGVGRAREENRANVIGVVSTKPGITLGFDDSSIIGNQSGYPIALSGRVPIKLSTENGPIKVGDKIMLSSIPGVGMKADGSGLVVGVAIEDFDGEHAYSLGFINQFGDDIAEPKYDPEDTNDDPRTQDGCYYGGGTMLGAEECDPEKVSNLIPNPAPKKTKEEAMKEALLELAEEEAVATTTPDGREVALGQSLMFVNLSWHQIAPEQNVLAELLSTSTLANGNGEETLWDRLKELGSNFVDGVLTLTGIKTDRVETNELCVDDVCVTANDLRALLNNAGQSSNGTGGSSNSGSSSQGETGAGDNGESSQTPGDTTGTEGGSGDANEEVPGGSDGGSGTNESGGGTTSSDSQEEAPEPETEEPEPESVSEPESNPAPETSSNPTE